MANLHTLATHDADGALRCVVESPRGSQAKFKYEPEIGVFTLKRSLILGVTYPYDWGFIPSTRAEDGDPLDVMIFHDVPTFPGIVMACEAIGALLVTQKASSGAGREPNHRLFAVPAGSEREHEWKDARQLPCACAASSSSSSSPPARSPTSRSRSSTGWDPTRQPSSSPRR